MPTILLIIQNPFICIILLLQKAQMSERIVTKEEVKKHNSAADCWIIINDRVYDVTQFVPRHPGEGISGQYISFYFYVCKFYMILSR